ncbi:hypothetical protein Tco_0646042, partial [Tanacetum coccineum]
MTTLAEHIIVAGAENIFPSFGMLSWLLLAKSRVFNVFNLTFIRVTLDLIDNGPLVYPTIEEYGQTRLKKYSELIAAQKLQDDCDVQASNIILYGLPPDVFSQLINDMHTIGMTMQQVQVNNKHLNALTTEWSKFVTESPQHSVPLMHPPPQQFTPVYASPIHHQQHHTPTNPLQQSVSSQPYISPSMTQQPQAKFPQMDSSLAVPIFQQGEYPINCINKAMTFLSVVASRQTQNFASTGNKGIATASKGNYAASQPRVVKCYNYQGEGYMARQCTQPKRPRNAALFKEKLMLVEAQEAGQILDEEQLAFLADPGIDEALVTSQTIPQNSAFQTEDLDAYDSDCDDISLDKAVLMANLSSCDSDVLSEVPYSDTYLNDMINQDVQEMPYSEQTYIVDSPDNEITSDINIILYSQYLQESQNAGIQDTNSSTPNDLLVLSLVEQMTDHVANLDKENQTNKLVNEFLTDELERYKERVTIFERRLNVDLNKRKKLIDSQMDDLIRNRNAKFAAFQQEIDTLKETLSNQVKEKEPLSTTLTVFKRECKEKESKCMDKEIVLENQNKEL